MGSGCIEFPCLAEDRRGIAAKDTQSTPGRCHLGLTAAIDPFDRYFQNLESISFRFETDLQLPLVSITRKQHLFEGTAGHAAKTGEGVG